MKSKIESHYSNKTVVRNYEKVRFASFGGCEIDIREKENIYSLLLKGKLTVLDCGAGTGRLTKYLLEREHTVYSLDNSDEMVKILKKIKNSNVYKGSIFNISFKENYFDAVVSLRVLFHFDNFEVFKILDEVHRVLKKNGVFVFDTLNPYSLERVMPNIFYKNRDLNYFLNKSDFEREISKNWIISKKSDFFIPRGFYLHSPAILVKLFKVFDRVLICLFPSLSSAVYWKLIKK